MSTLFRASFLLTFLFGINKVFALLRQYLTAQQFGLNPQMDAFNIANNVPDLLFSLISGSALALAFIPALTEYIDQKGESQTWRLFSQIANLVFLATAVLAVTAFVSAPLLVSWIIAPGFSVEQQRLTVELMRLNLCATLIFSISGLLTAALQAHKHFLFPALAPIFHNVGLIIGLLFFVNPIIYIGSFEIPGLGAGIYGLEYGVILGALFHLLIQVPMALSYKFKWFPIFSLKEPAVKRVLKLMGPRVLTVFLIQMIFFARDNFASGMDDGAISALTYGFFLLQVPETLIGTAIGTALLPTLADFVSEKKEAKFASALQASIKVIFASCLVISTLAILSLDTVLSLVFELPTEKMSLLSYTTKMFFLGLTAHSLLEVTSRAFYAFQDAKTPFLLTIGRIVLFVISGLVLGSRLGAPGLALADAVAVSAVVIMMLILLRKKIPQLLQIKGTVIRTMVSCIGIVSIFTFMSDLSPFATLTTLFVESTLSILLAGYILKPELHLLRKE